MCFIYSLLILFYTEVYAEDTVNYMFNITTNQNEVLVKEESLYGDTDNSSLNVNVIKKISEGEILIYTGLLGEYAGGEWKKGDTV